MKNSPLVSILVLNWNGEKIIQECIDSLLKTAYSPLEIIVVDNASVDNSLNILSGYKGQIIVIPNSENFGYAKGNNIGIAHAKGKYIVTLNNDIVVTPEWLDMPVHLLELNANIGIISCRQMNYYQKEKVDSLFGGPGIRHFPVQYQHRKTYVPIPHSQVLWANGASAIYRSSMIQVLGGFDEDFFAYHEESDLCMRAFLNGWRCAFAPSALVYHKSSFSFNKKKILMHYLSERNRYIFLYKNFTISFLLRALPWHIAGEIKDFFRFLIRYQGKSLYFKSRFDALKYILKNFGKYRAQKLLFKKNKKEFNILRKKFFQPF